MTKIQTQINKATAPIKGMPSNSPIKSAVRAKRWAEALMPIASGKIAYDVRSGKNVKIKQPWFYYKNQQDDRIILWVLHYNPPSLRCYNRCHWEYIPWISLGGKK